MRVPNGAMFDFLKNNPLVAGSRTARFRPRGMTMHLLIFFLVMMVSDFVASLPASIYVIFRALKQIDPFLLANADPEDPTALIEAFYEMAATVVAEDGYILTMLFSTLATAILCVIYCRFIERRPIWSMGLSVDSASLGRYGIGLLSGLAMFGLAFLIMYASGALTVSGGRFAPVMLALYLLAFLIQGASEEILVRGYFMTSLTNSTGAGSAVICSALLFAALHSGNVGASFLALFNIFLFGILLGLIVFRTRSLFTAMALHGIWNFAEGNIFGTAVSGIRPSHSFLISTLTDGRVTTNGGDFGPEGGAAVTLALVIALGVFLLLPQKSSPDADMPDRRDDQEKIDL